MSNISRESFLIYTGVKYFVKGVTGNYFRKITVIGKENIPKSGPTIICCNHANQFMDAMLVLAQSPRQLSFCMAASSYSFPIVGYLAKKINVIPVYRPDDGKILGKGKIKMISSNEIIGINTKFIEQTKKFELGVNSILINNKERCIIEKIESDNKIIIKDDEKLFETLKKEINNEYSYYLIPKMDNSTMYSVAYEKLHEGHAICIFPEGTSHDRSNFLTLKAGVALMALGAMAKHGTKHIKILSCGLTYSKREQFLSEVILRFGEPFEVPNEWGELFKNNKHKSIDNILKEIEILMKKTTVTAPTNKEYYSINTFRDLYIPRDVKLDMMEFHDLSLRFSYAYEKLKNKKETKMIKRKIFKYLELLEDTTLEDEDVKHFKYSYLFFFKQSLNSFFLFHIYLILVLPMIAISLPFVWIITKSAESARIKAQKKNPNKLKALDVVSSVKVTLFVKYLPFMFIFWLCFLYYVFNYYLKEFFYINYEIEYFSFWKIFKYSSFSFPIYSFLCTYMIDRLFFYLHTMKTNFIFFWIPRNVYKLREFRWTLESEVRKFVDSHIKENEFKQFKDNRIIKEENYHEDEEEEEEKEENNIKNNNNNNNNNDDNEKVLEEINKFLEQNEINY